MLHNYCKNTTIAKFLVKVWHICCTFDENVVAIAILTFSRDL
jgi:hypothetical protein